jgi:predicted TIM-barrel fold metal-dependent hydrolase
MWPPDVVRIATGEDWTVHWITLAINHPLDQIQSLPDELEFQGEYATHYHNPRTDRDEVVWTWKAEECGPVSMATTRDKFCSLCVGLVWPRGTEPRRLRLACRTAKGKEAHPVTPPVPLGFKEVSWDPKRSTWEEIEEDRKNGIYRTHSPLSSIGKWNVGHALTDAFTDFSTIFLWRGEIPAFFEIHSHVQSNHCSPLPPAWVHVWEALAEWHAIEPGYEWQDRLLNLPLLGKGEMGEISTLPTEKIAQIFSDQLKAGNMQEIFPALASMPDLVACPMPMDMEYMHFDGYFGIPLTQEASCTDTVTLAPRTVRWFCWNKLWKFKSNNTAGIRPIGGPSQDFLEAPKPTQGESWSWMTEENADFYQNWRAQFSAYSTIRESTWKEPGNARHLPFHHFDPRRYTFQAHPATLELPSYLFGPKGLAYALDLPIQSPGANKDTPYFGYKLYTALGWAPMDPFLKEPLERFYKHCEDHQIPLMNHGTPAGYYTHDRRHYFDLLVEQEKVAIQSNEDASDGQWIQRFAHTIPGPDGRPLTPRKTKEDDWWRGREEERIWWFTHHYVSAQSWKSVVKRYPNLKICLAHFGDSDHLRHDSWDARKNREPKDHFKGWADYQVGLTFGTGGSKIDPTRTHRFLWDLLDLIQPTNSVFVDLSYVILNEFNVAKFTEIFEWARNHKPILLERILWGTDWPLVGDEGPVKNSKGGNMLHRYAKGFRDAAPGLPPDFFLRACFLNPLQYLDLKGIRAKVGSGWDWIEQLDGHLFQMDAQVSPGKVLDKAELWYRTHAALSEKLGL